MRNWQASMGDWLEHSAVTFVSLYALLLLGPVMFSTALDLTETPPAYTSGCRYRFVHCC